MAGTLACILYRSIGFNIAFGIREKKGTRSSANRRDAARLALLSKCRARGARFTSERGSSVTQARVRFPSRVSARDWNRVQNVDTDICMHNVLIC